MTRKKFEVALWFESGERMSGHVIARDTGDAVFKFTVHEAHRRGLKNSDELRKLLEPDGILAGVSSVPMTRAEKIEAGLVWQVASGSGNAARVLFEGTRTAAEKWMRAAGIFKAWKNGSTDFSFGQLIWEAD